jgi:hypothetical protein
VAAIRTASIEEIIAQRRPQPAETLAPETVRWLAGLPGDVRPRQLPIEYVRIANAIARAWPDPRASLQYFDELLIDRRGGRRGFSFNVALELAGLKDHYETVIHPTAQTVWDQIVARHT